MIRRKLEGRAPLRLEHRLSRLPPILEARACRCALEASAPLSNGPTARPTAEFEVTHAATNIMTGPMRGPIGGLGLWLAALAVWASALGSAFAQARQERDGLILYWGLVPAAVVEEKHALNDMHGGPPPGGGETHHLVVAVYDAKSGQRIDDAVVRARLSETGIVDPAPRYLVPMKINDQMSYGQLFGTAKDGPYRFRIWVQARGGREVVFDIAANAPHAGTR